MICSSTDSICFSLPKGKHYNYNATLARKAFLKWSIKCFLNSRRPMDDETEKYHYILPRNWRLLVKKGPVIDTKTAYVSLLSHKHFQHSRDSITDKLSVCHSIIKILPLSIVNLAMKEVCKKNNIELEKKMANMSMGSMIELLLNKFLTERKMPLDKILFMRKIGSNGVRPVFAARKMLQGHHLLANVLDPSDDQQGKLNAGFNLVDSEGLMMLYRDFIDFFVSMKDCRIATNIEYKPVQKVFAVLIFAYSELVKEIRKIIDHIIIDDSSGNIYDLPLSQIVEIKNVLLRNTLSKVQAAVLYKMLTYFLVE